MKKEVINILVLVGESASGKSSVERELVNKYGFKKVVSYTTRQPRENEVDGVDYHFITQEHFNTLKDEGFFAEIGCYNNWWYGCAVKDCTDDKVAVLTPHGLRQMKAIEGLNIASYYIKVPQRDRLIKILQRGDNIYESMRRSISDLGMFDGIEDEVDYVIENDEYKKSVEEIAREVMSYEV